MTNFDKKKLADFLADNKSIEKAVADSIPDPQMPATPQTAPEEAHYFTPGNIITVSLPDGEREYRILTTKDEVVTYTDLSDPVKGFQTIPEEQLKKIGKLPDEPTKANVPALQELFSVFKEKTAYDLQSFLDWKKKWLDSGKLDEYRTQHGNVTISDEQIADLKRGIDLSVRALKTPGLDRDIYEYANKQLGLSAKILAGKHHPPENDIEGYIKYYSSDKANLDSFQDRIEKKPVSASVSASASAPDVPASPEKLHEYGGWPSNIYDKKNLKGTSKTWYSITSNDPLPDQEEWNRENETFKMLYRKYLEFIRALSPEERRFAKGLIDAKNAVTEAVKHEDIGEVETFREAFDEAIQEWARRWQSKKKLRFSEESFDELEKIVRKLPVSMRDTLEADGREVSQQIKDITLLLKERDLTEEDFEKLEKKLREYGMRVVRAEAEAARREHVDKRVNGIFAKKMDGTEHFIGHLRDISVTDENKHQKIQVPGRKQPISLKEYARTQVREKKENESSAITEQDMLEWPELVNAGMTVGAKVEKDWLKKFETRTMYERMYAKNPQLFTSLYATPTLDQGSNGVRYTPTRKFQMLSFEEKDVLLDIFHAHGVELTDQTRQERREERTKEGEESWLKKAPYRSTFHPDYRKKGIFGIKHTTKNALVTGFVPDRDMGSMAKENIFGARDRYQKLKSRRMTYLDDAFGYRFREKERMLDAKLAEALDELKKKPASSILSSFQKELADYEKSIAPLLDQHTKERALPPDQAGRDKRMEAIAKIDAILGVREKNLLKNPINKTKASRLQWYLFALAMAAGIAGSYQHIAAGTDKGERTPVTAAEPTHVAEKTWREYMNTANPEEMRFVDNMAKLTPELLLQSILHSDKPDLYGRLLKEDGYRVINDNAYILPYLTEEERGKISTAIRWLEKISQSIDAPANTTRTMRREPILAFDNHHIGPQKTIGDYIATVKAKMAAADNLKHT
jgi:hypothetical protein